MNENDNMEDVVCDVCYDDLPEEEPDSGQTTDAIVICDICNVSVHQSCYGRELKSQVPEGDWHCNRCSNLTKYKLESMRCKLCPDMKGAIV